jgi:hypothetical protein
MGARCIGIRAVEARGPLICAVAVETAKTHGTTQLRRMNFFEFITLRVCKKLNPPGFESCGSGKDRIDRKGNAVVTFADFSHPISVTPYAQETFSDKFGQQNLVNLRDSCKSRFATGCG